MTQPITLSVRTVAWLQVMLDAAGIDCGPTDGEWGPRTAVALGEFSRRATADGVVMGGTATPALPVPPVKPDTSVLVKLILQVAGNFVGLAEVRQNTTWRDPSGRGRGEQFPAFLRSVGWSAPDAYCAAFAKAVFRGAGASVEGMSLGSVESFENLRRLGRTVGEPAAGCAFFMQHGSSDKGHAGIVTGPARDGVFPTIEGNTDALGTREGDGVYAKTRRLDFTRGPGLHLLGFGVPLVATVPG